MPPLKRFAAAICLAALGLLAPAASFAAQKVLFLTTAEVSQRDDNKGLIDQTAACGTNDKIRTSGNWAIEHARTQLANGGEILDYAGALSPSSLLDIINNSNWEDTKEIYQNRNGWGAAEAILKDKNKLGSGDIVFLMAQYTAVDVGKLVTIAEQIKYRPDLTFVILFDTCTECGYDFATCKRPEGDGGINMARLTQAIVNKPLGWNLQPTAFENRTLKSSFNGWGTSAYTTGLPQLYGQHAGSIQCTPQQNVLFSVPTPKEETGYQFAYEENTGFLCSKTTLKEDDVKNNCNSDKGVDATSWPELNASSAYALLIPTWQSNHGAGACMYIGEDVNIFDQSPGDGDLRGAQQPAVVDMFLALPNSACKAEKPAGICDDLKDGEKCMLADVVDATTMQPKDLAVLPTLKSDAAKLQCAAKVWCEESKVAQNAGSNLCCGKDAKGNMLKPTGKAGNQICCPAGYDNIGGKCAPRPAAPVLVNNPWALALLGAAVTAAAARRRRN